MSCYAKHPTVPGIECWHAPGHAGNHDKESRSWPNLDDPLQRELAALRKVAEVAREYVLSGDADEPGWESDYDALRAALREAGYA